MKASHLKVIRPAAFNQNVEPAPHEESPGSSISLRAAWSRFATAAALVWSILTFPFVVVSRVFGIFVNVGVGAFRFAIRLVFALFGMALLGFICYGFIRTLAFPLFH